MQTRSCAIQAAKKKNNKACCKGVNCHRDTFVSLMINSIAASAKILLASPKLGHSVSINLRKSMGDKGKMFLE